MEKLGYLLPVGMIIFVFLLKLLLNEKLSFETFKRLLVETSIDVISLGISLMISYIIAIANKIVLIEKMEEKNKPIEDNLVKYWNCFGNGLLILFGYIVVLAIVVFISKFFISKYIEKDQMRYIVIGIILGYMFAIPAMSYAISLIKNIGGI